MNKKHVIIFSTLGIATVATSGAAIAVVVLKVRQNNEKLIENNQIIKQIENEILGKFNIEEFVLQNLPSEAFKITTQQSEIFNYLMLNDFYMTEKYKNFSITITPSSWDDAKGEIKFSVSIKGPSNSSGSFEFNVTGFKTISTIETRANLPLYIEQIRSGVVTSSFDKTLTVEEAATNTDTISKFETFFKVGLNYADATVTVYSSLAIDSSNLGIRITLQDNNIPTNNQQLALTIGEFFGKKIASVTSELQTWSATDISIPMKISSKTLSESLAAAATINEKVKILQNWETSAFTNLNKYISVDNKDSSLTSMEVVPIGSDEKTANLVLNFSIFTKVVPITVKLTNLWTTAEEAAAKATAARNSNPSFIKFQNFISSINGITFNLEPVFTIQEYFDHFEKLNDDGSPKFNPTNKKDLFADYVANKNGKDIFANPLVNTVSLSINSENKLEVLVAINDVANGFAENVKLNTNLPAKVKP